MGRDRRTVRVGLDVGRVAIQRGLGRSFCTPRRRVGFSGIEAVVLVLHVGNAARAGSDAQPASGGSARKRTERVT